MADQNKFVQVQKLSLAGSGITATATSIILTSFQTPDGTNVTMTDFGATGHITLEPGTSKEENCSFTGITQNANGTATLTGVTRGLKFVSPYTEDSDLKQAHAGGSIALISNSSAFYDELSSKDNDETINGKWTFPAGGNANAPVSGTVYSAPTDDLEYASKKYADDLAIAGSPDMSTTVKGLAEEATEAEIDAGTGVGGTGARLAVNPSTLATSTYGTQLPSSDEKDALAGTSGSPSTSNKYVTNDDVDTAATASKVVRREASGDVTVPLTPGDDADASSKKYVDDSVAGFLSTTKQYVSAAQVDTHSTSGEQTLFTTSVAGGTLGTNNAIKVQIIYDNFDTPSNESTTFLLKYGATTIATEIFTAGGSVKSDGDGTIDLNIIATGSTGTQKATFLITFGEFAGGATKTWATVVGTATEDSTGALDLVLTAQNSTNSANHGIEVESVIANIIN